MRKIINVRPKEILGRINENETIEYLAMWENLRGNERKEGKGWFLSTVPSDELEVFG